MGISLDELVLDASSSSVSISDGTDTLPVTVALMEPSAFTASVSVPSEIFLLHKILLELVTERTF